MPDQPQDILNNKKRAYGTFARLPLAKALELPQKIYELGEGEPVRRLLVFDKLKRSPTSGTSRELLGACNSGYGLVTGNYTSEFLGLTDLGKQILAAPDERAKTEAIFQALFGSEIFSGFITRFINKNIPIITAQSCASDF